MSSIHKVLYMKRAARIGAIIKILSDSPSKSFGLSYFCETLNAAKSSISEDIKIAKEISENIGIGKIVTTSGAGGGVKFIPDIKDKALCDVQNKLCNLLKDPTRILGGGFLYTSDIFFNANFVKEMAPAFAKKFLHSGADYVATIETKGIPLALMTAQLLNLPTIVVRREAKISEGPTISINYFSGSTDIIQKMSMAKKAIGSGKKAIIIDDFMRAGGSLKGIAELLGEFGVEVAGIGVAISTLEPSTKKVRDYTSLVYLGDVDESKKLIEAFPNKDVLL